MSSNRFTNCCSENRKIINVKKGQFLAPWDMGNVIKELRSGNKNILITEKEQVLDTM